MKLIMIISDIALAKLYSSDVILVICSILTGIVFCLFGYFRYKIHYYKTGLRSVCKKRYPSNAGMVEKLSSKKFIKFFINNTLGYIEAEGEKQYDYSNVRQVNNG
jgi:hypothetical protein